MMLQRSIHEVDPRAGQQNSHRALAPADDHELDPRAGATKNLRRHAEVYAPSVHTGNWNHESSPSEMMLPSKMKSEDDAAPPEFEIRG